MKTYDFDGYKMTLQDTGKVKNDHVMVEYTFSTPDGELLFSGDDLGCSPLHGPESMESAKALLCFLTVRKGDTDEEYFDSYTPRQLEFSESMDCEHLQIYTLDGEDD